MAFLTLIVAAILVAVGAAVGRVFFGPDAVFFIGFFGFPLAWALLYGLSSGPAADAVADARAIEAAWQEGRETWAKAMVAASVVGAEADVEAWSHADIALGRMVRSAKEESV
jgi:hypothetical protein